MKAALRHKDDLKKRFMKDIVEAGKEALEKAKCASIDADKAQTDALAALDELSELDFAEDDPFARAVFTHPAIIFLLSVSFPCWIMYQQTVEELLELVKGGCAESLVKLLRLDRRFLENPDVRSAYLAVLGDEKHPWREEVDRAPANPAPKDISLTSVKYSIAGLIIEFAEQSNQHFKQEFRAVLIANTGGYRMRSRIS